MKKLFTATQIFIATMLGTPIAGTYCLLKNYDALGVEKNNITVMIVGAILVSALTFPLYFFADFEKFELVFAFSYLAIAYFYALFAATRQMEKEDIKNNSKYDFRPNWQIPLISILSAAGFFAYNVLFVLVLAFLNLTEL